MVGSVTDDEGSSFWGLFCWRLRDSGNAFLGAGVVFWRFRLSFVEPAAASEQKNGGDGASGKPQGTVRQRQQQRHPREGGDPRQASTNSR
jgi:hypothetical protein